MKKFLIGSVVSAVIFGSLAISAFAAGNGTQVYRFSDEPFDYWQSYFTAGFFPGPAETFGEDVDVHYEALNSETVRLSKDGDVDWALTQHGTATVYAQDDNEVLYSGPFQVEEVARDDGGDAGCLWVDGQHAWAGNCSAFFTNLDFLQYNWKITGNSVYYFNGSIKGAGNWCYSSKQGGEVGPGC